MRWMVQRTKLDSDQEELITRHIRGGSGNVWIKGHAGSGKSVLLVHGLRDKLVENKNLRVGVVLYTRAMVALIKTGLRELGVEKEFDVQVPVMTCEEFRKGRYPNSSQIFDILFCDEVQDLTPSTLKLLRAKATRVVVAGDSQQSIYDHDASTKEAIVSPDQIGALLDGQSHELPTIYRLTRSIIKLVDKLLGGSILSARRDANKKDVQVQLCYTNDAALEVKYVWQKANKQALMLESTAVLLSNRNHIVDFCNQVLVVNNKDAWPLTLNHFGKEDFKAMNRYLLAQGIKLQYVGREEDEWTLEDAYINHRVMVMNYHSVKGLDFENVYLPWVSAGKHLSNTPKNKTLFMVAMTRSKGNLMLTHCGTPSSLVDTIAASCAEPFEITDTPTVSTSPPPLTYDF